MLNVKSAHPPQKGKKKWDSTKSCKNRLSVDEGVRKLYMTR